MAVAPAHKLGQIIGDLLEAALREPLEAIAVKHGLYLDYKHKRPARGHKAKVGWTDRKGNTHDLDYVLESGGSEDVLGAPKAFIETAWRKYTKHSRNKAQEIHGAIIPLAETFSKCNPFLGVVLAGVFTEGSLQQLRSNQFSILYYPYEAIVQVFTGVGVDVAFDEKTPDEDLRAKVDAVHALSSRRWKALARRLREVRRDELDEFLNRLEVSLMRKIVGVFVTSLHGATCEVATIEDAVRCIEEYDELRPGEGFVRYEVSVRYSNGDKIEANFQDKRTAVGFLKGLC